MVNRSDERIGVEKIRHCAFDQRSTEWLSAQCPRHLLYAKAGINQRDGAETREARLPDEFQAVRHFRDHSDDALTEITVVMIGIH